ncbi:MAG: outer membrane beta-barrel protein, partial [Pseudomonadales bacterium]
DYLATDGDDLAETGSALGVAAAGRYAFSDTTGFALRVERVTAEEDFLIADDDLEYWTITGTLDHKLTPELMIRAEGRFDKSDEVANLGFADGDGTLTEDKQFTAMVEVIYQLGGF